MRYARPSLGALALGNAVLACTFSACTSRLPDVPNDTTIGTQPLTVSAPVHAGSESPEIAAMRFSSLDLRRPSRWSGQIVTSTDVASVEVRTNLFSLDVPRTAFGRFAFDVDVLDLPPIFIRPYRLRVIARDAAGAAKEEDLPFEIR